ncbi:hypothetical protein ABT263_17990 [Kitasatospora sp. NPDC001603]|uniref:hypothetical protein n=1 Tax=Kitasatospora sp. NPDC001603 TaxID=3154388 RepID=UPI00332779F0
MRYTTSGRRTGLRVSEYALGTANFGHRLERRRARLSKVSAVPLGVPHEAIAASPGGIQGGDPNRVIAPLALVA